MLVTAVMCMSLLATEARYLAPTPIAQTPAIAPTAQTQTPIPERLYNGINRPVMMTIHAPDDAVFIDLILMDAQGVTLATRRDARPGRLDLAALMPEIWRLDRAAYLQLYVDNKPIGSALVLQPMLSRMAPLAELAVVRPGGPATTRIVDWYNELDPPPQANPASLLATPMNDVNDSEQQQQQQQEPDSAGDAAAVSASDSEAKSDDDGSNAASQTSASAPPARARARVSTGLRIYGERDVILQTSLGEVRFAMRPDQAPNTVWNFLQLCQGGFYTDVMFHRIVPMTRDGDPFVIQAGDPSATGDGGPGYWLPIENSELAHDFGVISMARDTPPDSAGSQFFVCLSRAGTARLDGNYCAFGYAVTGADVIQAIATVELTGDPALGRPADPPMIHDARVVPAEPRVEGIGRADDPLYARDAPVEITPPRVPR